MSAIQRFHCTTFIIDNGDSVKRKFDGKKVFFSMIVVHGVVGGVRELILSSKVIQASNRLS